MRGMPRLLNYLAPLYVWLYALDPALPQALFVSLVFFTVWLIRKLAPNQWEAFANLIHVKADDTAWWQNELRALWQMLPAAIIGTIYGVLGTGADPWPTLRLTLLSLIAPVVHRIAARYQGGLGKGKQDPGGPSGSKPAGVSGAGVGMFDDTTPPSLPGAAMRGGTIQKVEIVITSNQDPRRIAQAVIDHLAKVGPGPHAAALLLAAACALPLTACSQVNWPKALQCAGELQQPVLDAVTKVLHGTGDVESELADVARQHGAGVVECAVQQVIDDLTSKPSASVVEARAVHRGREFLARAQR